jgi:hypothetical protein
VPLASLVCSYHRCASSSLKKKFGGAIRALTLDKAHGPDGFMGRFLQSAWHIIRPEIMAVFDTFWCGDTRNLSNINGALMVLLPKSSHVATIKDFRPIALIHLIGKLISKVLSNRLATYLDKWFIKVRMLSSRASCCMIISVLCNPRPSCCMRIASHACCSRYTLPTHLTLWRGNF